MPEFENLRILIIIAGKTVLVIHDTRREITEWSDLSTNSMKEWAAT